MFCPNCGKPDQTPETYCRACGSFLKNPDASAMPAFGGRTPSEHINSINILSVIASLASIVVAVLMYLTRFNEPVILYLAAAILLCNAIWHVSNLLVGLKLRKKLRGQGSVADRAAPPSTPDVLPAAETRDLLQVGHPAAPLPISITEDTTRDLKDKIRR